MSATLLRFLQETLHRCLHRCYFVITKMDNSDPAHRTDIVDFARQRIITDLNVTNPRLYAESAITMLPVKKIPSDKIEDWAFYSTMFKQFESILWDNIRRSKDIVLNEHIDNLIQEIVQQCSLKIKEREVTIKKEREFLAAHKIEKIQNVCNTMVSQSADAINSILDGISISFYWAERNSKSRAESIINEGTMSMSVFKDSKLPSIRNAVEQEARKDLESINKDLNQKIKQCIDAQILKMQRVFASHYDSFPTLRPTNRALTVDLIQFRVPDMSFSIALSKIDELNDKENTTTAVATAAVAVATAFIIGPFAALVAGGLTAAGASGNKSDEMRASAKPLVNNEISSFLLRYALKLITKK